MEMCEQSKNSEYSASKIIFSELKDNERLKKNKDKPESFKRILYHTKKVSVNQKENISNYLVRGTKRMNKAYGIYETQSKETITLWEFQQKRKIKVRKYI